MGFWDVYVQDEWQVDFPASWTKLFARTASNLADCNVLVMGMYKFTSPYSSQPSTGSDYTAIADWVTDGGVLFVIHEYWGTPGSMPVTPVTNINTALTGIGTQAKAGTTESPAPQWFPVNQTPSGTYDVTISHALTEGVTKLSVAAPGYMTLGTSTLVFEARQSPSTPYTPILSVEDFGAGSVVFLADFSVVNNFDASSRAATGNKVERLLCNLGVISAN